MKRRERQGETQSSDGAVEKDTRGRRSLGPVGRVFPTAWLPTVTGGDKHAGARVFGEVSAAKCWREAQTNANVERRQCSVCGAAARSCSKLRSH